VPARLPIDWHAAAKLYEAGWTQRRLADHYGVHWLTVQRHLKALGAKKPARPKRPLTDRRLRSAWENMHRRCSDPKHHSYHRYGAQGVAVARAWSEFEPFRAWALEAGYQPGQSLHRRDERRAFSPRNCYWGARRRDSAAPKYKAFRETKTVVEWARDPRCVVSADALSRRLRYGVALEAAINRAWEARVRHGAEGEGTAPEEDRRLAAGAAHVAARDDRCRDRRELGVLYSTIQVGLRSRR